MHRANIQIVVDSPTRIVIKDVGPWERHPTITNDAEAVVARLHAEGRLPKGKRLFYYDSEGVMDEIEHDGAGNFTAFVLIDQATDYQPGGGPP